MQGFEEVTFSWRGEEFTVQPERQLMMVAKIEDALTADGGESALTFLLHPVGPSSYARLAMGYGAALRYAGADVSDDEVFLSIQDGFASGDGSAAQAVQSATITLLSVVSPPMAARLFGDGKKKAEGESAQLVRTLHQIVVGNDWMSAPDFWRSAPGQIWWLIEDKMPNKSLSDPRGFEDAYQALMEAKKAHA